MVTPRSQQVYWKIRGGRGNGEIDNEFFTDEFMIGLQVGLFLMGTVIVVIGQLLSAIIMVARNTSDLKETCSEILYELQGRSPL